MQAAGASQNKWYLAQLAAQDAANTSGEPMDVLLNQAYERLGLPSTLAKSSSANSSNPSSMADEYSALNNLEPGGGGSGSRGGREGGTYGQMTAAERSTITDIADVTSVLGGLGVPGVGVLGTGLKGALGIDSALPSLGLVSRGYASPTEADYADMAATYGVGSRQENSARTSAAIGNSLRGGLGEDASFAGEAAAAAGRAEAANRAAAENEAGMRDAQGGREPGDGRGPGGTTGDSAEGGHGTAGDGSMNARGGVRRASKATKAIFGEAGPETAVFVPDYMRRGGKQPNEDRIIAALEQLLAELKGKS